ncbi:hypothetical protein [Schaalia sp. ZJ1691]|uniref:hypothetical protein n=1 Tax=Schaalia sp. ZJ1691 TaxID=2709404 RepID=UPI0013EA4F50|nr:hypothetical protein [Schaalia sp. ZJ1691]
MRLSRIAQPPGIRSTKEGGYWENAKSKDGRIYLQDDFRAIRANVSLTDKGWAMFLAELNKAMTRAENGRWNFDTTRDKGIVCQTRRHEEVLEARLKTTVDADGAHWLVRLYFTEPECEEGLLLSLCMGWKVPGQAGLDQQDRHIDQAYERFCQWL